MEDVHGGEHSGAERDGGREREREEGLQSSRASHAQPMMPGDTASGQAASLGPKVLGAPGGAVARLQTAQP